MFIVAFDVGNLSHAAGIISPDRYAPGSSLI